MSGCCSGNGQQSTIVEYHDGKSAYEVAVDNGFVGTEEEWLESLVGPPGDPGEPGEPGPPGDSAYQVWLNQGNTGTEADYLASLKGRKGDPGPGNVLSIGSVMTGAPTDPASATITGDSPAQVLNLTIPQGIQGEPGPQGVGIVSITVTSTPYVIPDP